ncbi:DUF3299 domain-containing protein [Salinivibrio socompensis]|uniref:DUF3299 domain-containing protein n=1 Tax=Salinivibrio socompensis TaxID=1510206 RepID=UPI00047042A5|nr:DUF3299 domain-containing protein [Salinivibrio socompensis]
MKKRITLGLIAIMTAFVGHVAIANNQPLTLDWIDLVPEHERAQFDRRGMPDIRHDAENPQSLVGSVRPELNNSQVKIPGFVIPLEGDDKVVTEFLLVPFLGACIHVPPPPPNQIIYVKFADGAPIQALWDVVYVEGTLNTEHVIHDLAEVGYVLEGTALSDYDDG